MVGGIALAAIVLVFGLSFVYRTSSLLASIIRPPVPAELQAAGVVTGKTLFSKAPYYHDDSLGVITDIEQGDDGHIILIGRRGAVYLDSDSRPANLAHYSLCMSDVVLARLSTGAFLCRGSWSQEATLFDRVGHKVWSYNARSPGIDDTVAGQIGGAEVVAVGLNGGGGVVS